MKEYILNKETQKIELHFSKEEYQNLSESSKKELRSAFLFSPKCQAWVSRSKNNHYSAIRVANSLGFTERKQVGERLSFSKELERKIEKAGARQERYGEYSKNASERARNLQSEFNEHRQDISFLTQPIINGHKGSESFGRKREKIFDRYRKGFDEYRKSEYFSRKADDMQSIIDKEKFNDRSYLSNRIKECDAVIRKLERNIIYYEKNINISNEKKEYYINETLEKIEYQIDKLSFLKNCMDKLTVITRDDLKVGYEVKIRNIWRKVLKLNNNTVEVQPVQENMKMIILNYNYEEIQEMKIPCDFKEEKEELINPFNENDILVMYAINGVNIIEAYKVIKRSAKSIVMQELIIVNNIPSEKLKLAEKEKRRKIIKSKINNEISVFERGCQLYKYC